MKKLVVTIAMALMLILPTRVFAEKIDLSKYNTLNLEETLKDEQSYNSNFTYDLSNYSENDNQITIYIFRGRGCHFCENFLTYLGNDLVKNDGQYFKVVSFETWNSKDNLNLLKKVDAFLGITDPNDIGAVPLIIIGNQHMLGFDESTDKETLHNAIEDLYNSKDRYDVFEEMNKEEKEEKGSSNASIIIWNIIIATVGVLIVLAYNNYTKNEIISAVSKKTK